MNPIDILLLLIFMLLLLVLLGMWWAFSRRQTAANLQEIGGIEIDGDTNDQHQCGHGFPFHTIWNQSGAKQRITATIENTGIDCTISVSYFRELPQPQGGQVAGAGIAIARPLESGSGTIEVPNGQRWRISFDCENAEGGSRPCKGTVKLFLHT